MTFLITQFLPALMDPQKALPADLVDGSGQPAGARFSVYRNNVIVGLIDALCSSFPCVFKLLGEENFRGLAGIFVRQHPPRSPVMMHYGAEFPAFLASIPDLARFGYLPDIARLEILRRQSYHAADHTPIDISQLTDITDENLMSMRVSLAPSLRLLRSDWPIYDIWATTMAPPHPAPRPIPQSVLITRKTFDPDQIEITPGIAKFILILQSDGTIAAAIEAGQSDPEFDLSTALGLLLSTQSIHALIPGETP